MPVGGLSKCMPLALALVVVVRCGSCRAVPMGQTGRKGRVREHREQRPRPAHMRRADLWACAEFSGRVVRLTVDCGLPKVRGTTVAAAGFDCKRGPGQCPVPMAPGMLTITGFGRVI